jgi:hypothetical protein
VWAEEEKKFNKKIAQNHMLHMKSNEHVNRIELVQIFVQTVQKHCMYAWASIRDINLLLVFVCDFSDFAVRRKPVTVTCKYVFHQMHSKKDFQRLPLKACFQL